MVILRLPDDDDTSDVEEQVVVGELSRSELFATLREVQRVLR